MRTELQRIFDAQDHDALNVYLEVESTADIMEDLRGLVEAKSVRSDDVQIIAAKLGDGWLRNLANALLRS